MAVAVEQNLRRSWLEPQDSCTAGSTKFLEQHARGRNGSRLVPRRAAQQRRRILADGREAARLAEDDLPAGDRVRMQRFGVARGERAGFCRADPSRFAAGRSTW